MTKNRQNEWGPLNQWGSPGRYFGRKLEQEHKDGVFDLPNPNTGSGLYLPSYLSTKPTTIFMHWLVQTVPWGPMQLALIDSPRDRLQSV